MNITEKLLSRCKVSTSNSYNGMSCIEWLDSKTKGGYGKLWINRTCWYTHRLSWHLFRGKIPKGIYVLHCCDNRNCCNPAPLFLVMQQHNIQDAVKKNLMDSGEFLFLNNGKDSCREKVGKY